MQGPFAGIVYHIRVKGGVYYGRKYLCSTPDGSKVHLHHEDDGSRRQNWLFVPCRDGTFNIQVLGGISNARCFLSCSSDGTRMDLHDIDDGSGRQRWILEPLNASTGCCVIRVKCGTPTLRTYLSCPWDGSKVDLWTHDEGSGRQVWLLQPEHIRLSRIDFKLQTAVVTHLPDFATQVTVTNDTSVSQHTTVRFLCKAQEASSFERGAGDNGAAWFMSDTIGSAENAAKKVAVPCLVAGRAAMCGSAACKWTMGGEDAVRDDPREYSLPVVVPSNTKVVVQAHVPMAELVVPCTAIGRSELNGREVLSHGVWRGTSLGEPSYLVKQLLTGGGP